ncbi:hypothetical protein SBC1_76230 (plasmid) [Caballeronia sp. SBC1]|nr:hypothetical protein SBC2_79410 [Caballeronia sp. SBC2]QIN67576.1 hypothetical protein SBC1_76230 [Caballeronia sp. SBC1]
MKYDDCTAKGRAPLIVSTSLRADSTAVEVRAGKRSPFRTDVTAAVYYRGRSSTRLMSFTITR